MSKLKEHFRHLLFNDAMSTHNCGMNHNAMDRSTVYDHFLINIVKENFDEIYEDVFRKYQKNRSGFSRNPFYLITCPVDEVPPELFDEGAVQYEDAANDYIEICGGYWKSLEELDEYVNEVATDETVAWLLTQRTDYD